MKVPRIAQAMTDIDDDLIAGAIEYHRVPLSTRFFRSQILKACACFLLVAVMVSTIFLGRKTESGPVSPFVLAAYAASSDDGNTTSSTLLQGMKVPISTFETTNGLRGFVISCNKEDDERESSISVISSVEYAAFEEIVGIAVDPTQDYFFYIPDDTAEKPYVFPLFLSDKDTNLICQYEITIDDVEGSYYAELTEVSIVERVTQ